MQYYTCMYYYIIVFYLVFDLYPRIHMQLDIRPYNAHELSTVTVHGTGNEIHSCSVAFSLLSQERTSRIDYESTIVQVSIKFVK